MAKLKEDEKIIQFTFGLDDPELEDEERLRFSRRMLRELRDIDEVEKAERTEDPNPEASSMPGFISKPGFTILIGVVTASVGIDNVKKFLEFLVDRLQDKPMKVIIKVGEKEIVIEAHSRYELAKLKKTALDFVKAMDEDND